MERKKISRILSHLFVACIILFICQQCIVVSASADTASSDIANIKNNASVFLDCIQRETSADTEWKDDVHIDNIIQLYEYDDSISAYVFEYCNSLKQECGYIVAGANENYAPIIEYTTSGKFIQTNEKIYYFGEEPADYYIKNKQGNFYSISTNLIKEPLRKCKKKEYNDEWINFSGIDLKAAKFVANSIAYSNSTPVKSGNNPITNPTKNETGWKSKSSLNVKKYDLNYFTTSDFKNYTAHCAPTAGTNLLLYWYNRSSSKYGNLRYLNSWDKTFSQMYSLMKTDKNGTYDSDIQNGIKKYLNKVDFGNSTVKLDNDVSWNDCVNEITGGSNGYPFILTVEGHYLYGNHAVLALGYMDFKYEKKQTSTNSTHSRYLRIADGWNNSANRFIHFTVGHKSSQKTIITMHPKRSSFVVSD